jgi:hypothetical protein
MCKKNITCRASGLVLILILFADILYSGRLIAGPAAAFLYHAAHALLLALALCLLGVARPEKGPATYLVPALLSALFYGAAALYGGVGDSNRMQALSPGLLGRLLLALCFVLGAWSLALPKERAKAFDLKEAVMLFALIQLACAGDTVQRALHTAGAARLESRLLFNFLLWYQTVYGALLLPFLRRERAGGAALAILGGAGFAGLLILGFTPLGASVSGAQPGSPLRFLYLLKNVLFSLQGLLPAFLFGGLWCALSGRKKQRSA